MGANQISHVFLLNFHADVCAHNCLTYTLVVVAEEMVKCIIYFKLYLYCTTVCIAYKKMFIPWMCCAMGRRGGSVGRALDLRSKDSTDWRFKSRLRQEHKKHLWELFWVKNVALTHCQCAQPLCVHACIRMIMYTR